MRYFYFKARLDNPFNPRIDEGRNVCDEVSEKCVDYCDSENDFNVLVSALKDRECDFVLSGNCYDEEMCLEGERFWKSLGIPGRITEHHEVSAEKARKQYYRKSQVENHDDIDGLMGLDVLGNSSFIESIVETVEPEKLHQIAADRNNEELIAESERIEQSKVDKCVGHPVHYVIEDSNSHSARKVAEALTGCLFFAKRLKSRRLLYVPAARHFYGENIMNLYENMRGGAVMVELPNDEPNSRYANSSKEIMETFGAQAVRFKNEVLTIFFIRRNDANIMNELLNKMNDEIFLVKFREDLMDKEQSAGYISRIADEKEIADKTGVIALLDNESDKYYASDLDRIFDDYYSQYMRSVIYPAYYNLEKPVQKETVLEGSVAEELDRMIGLDSVKKVIYRTVSFFRLNALYHERGLSIETPARSMIFTGNPGTAKTTVARLAARIFKDNGLLDSGCMVEVGRAELVGKYVGHTAPLVKDAFRRAKGAVLFIDEAYSLVDDRDGLYGDEAINTIVEEMENHRSDTVVIFAAYPDKMESFMQKNPGLRSRIAFHVDFPDYSTDELREIRRLMVSKKNMNLSADAEEKAARVFSEIVRTEDFGNGRFVRNILEQAVMSLAERLAGKNPKSITDCELTTLIADDFIMPELRASRKEVRIGF